MSANTPDPATGLTPAAARTGADLLARLLANLTRTRAAPALRHRVEWHRQRCLAAASRATDG